MAIFAKKEEKKAAPKVAKEKPAKKDAEKKGIDLLAVKSAVGVLIAPHITEKSVFLGESVKRGETLGGQYVFKVEGGATKPMVKRAVEDAYKVKVLAVKILARRDKTRFARGRRGVHAGAKKALVILKKGDKIEFI
ncbi:MAG: 50S ribosomal protein L23 [Candidatus Niyogibacteria bacterium]|nr:50S ribosomal protein L23 [Candidatus Niyogibacteria bacterium]